MEELFGPLAATLINLLPLEVIIFIVVVWVLHKTGSLKRMATTLNQLSRGLIDARKTQKEFAAEIKRIEINADSEIERVMTQAEITNRTNNDLENLRLRKKMFEMIQAHIDFLQDRVIIYEAFIMVILAQKIGLEGIDMESINELYEEQMKGFNFDDEQNSTGGETDNDS